MSDKKPEVVEPNTIVEARGSMNKAFLDTFHAALAQVAQSDDIPELLEYEWDAKQYKNMYGLKYTDNIYKKMANDADNCFKNDTIFIGDYKKGEEIHVFSRVHYDGQAGKISIRFSNEFKTLLVQSIEQKGKKVYFSLPDTLRMGSMYSKRMYPILLEYIGHPIVFTGEGSLKGQKFDRIDSIQNFRDILSLPDSYNIARIKTICKTIVDEVQEFTPYEASVSYNALARGQGRYPSVTHVCWNIHKKK